MDTLIIDAGTLVTMAEKAPVARNVRLTVKDGRIDAISAIPDPATRPDARYIDARDTVVFPGLVDAHLHAGLGLPIALGRVAAVGGYDPGGWPSPAQNTAFCCGGDINAVLQDYNAAPVTHDEVRGSAYSALLDGLCCGVTTFIEGGSPHPEACEEAAAELGVRYMSALAIIEHVSDGAGGLKRAHEVADILKRAEAFLKDGPLGPLTTRALAPVAAHGCSPELLRGLADLSRDYDAPVITHIATMQNEAAQTKAQWGLSPFARLGAAGLLNERLIAIHAGYPEEDDWPHLAAAGLTVVHCPQGSTLLPTGYFTAGAIPRYDNAGVRLAMGTDVSRNAPLLHQIADAASFHKDRSLDAGTMDAPIVLKAATRGGGAASRFDVGVLQPGRPADLMIVDTSGAHYALSENRIRAFVETGRLSDIDTVVIGGEVLVKDGAPVHASRKAASKAANTALQGALRRLSRGADTSGD